MTVLEDRRRKRSDDPLVALHHQLARARLEGRFDAIVVADTAGLVVAGAGAWAACEELAAYAPLLAPAPGRPAAAQAEDADSRFAELRAEVEVRPVDVGGQTVLLCARGGAPGAPAMARAAQGVARILQTAA
jgi:hypothetical protein